MASYFPSVEKIRFQGPGARTPFAFRHYDPEKVVRGRTMREHLRFAVCYWHSFRGDGSDPFGAPTIMRRFGGNDPITAAEHTLRAAFEFFQKLGVDYWCFHTRDIAPESESLTETNKTLDRIVELAAKLQEDTGIVPLWGTTALFNHPCYSAGGATNPDPHVFALAAAQVKKGMEVTQRLGGKGFVFWGGREGYETLLNTDMKRETDNLARFLHLAVDYKKKIGFQGPLYIEPKPREPSKHQYDYDAQSTHAFLLKHGLAGEFLLNIEANHATLAGHSFHHELEYCVANGLLGSVDANRGDLLCGWDTDQFPTDVAETTLAMHTILEGGGLREGGLNFDAKPRRQSIDPEDLFHAHIGAMDAFARGLEIAGRLLDDGVLTGFRAKRYADWDGEFGRRISHGELDFEALERHALTHPRPTPRSGRAEMLENLLNDYLR